MKRESLLLLLLPVLLTIFNASPLHGKGKKREEVSTFASQVRKKKEEAGVYVVLRWTRGGMKIYVMEEEEDARFIAEESRERGERVFMARGEPKRVFLSCAMGYFLMESHPRVNTELLIKDIRQECGGDCRPLNCGVEDRESALKLLEEGGAGQIVRELRETYRRIGE